MTELEEYYNKFNEEKRLNSRHGQVEYRVTMSYIMDLLKKIEANKTAPECTECYENESPNNGKSLNNQIKIIDIGAGTGRYAVPLSEYGYDVTAIELVKHNLGILKAKKSDVKAIQGNALNLKKIEAEQYDLTLLFGPMYHLFGNEDKEKALQEAKRVTKPGGYILVAYVMNEYGVLTYAFKEQHIKECIEEKRFTKDFKTISGPSDLYDYMRIEDINALNERVNLERVKILSPDGPANYMRPFLNKLTEQEFEYFVDYQRSTCERQDLIGAGAHTVDILRKKELTIRKATMEDLEEITKVEAICFPPKEAATKESFERRLQEYADYFWLLFEDNKLVGFVNGMVTNEADLTDEMYENAKIHDKNGDWQMIFGVNTIPEYRRRGYAQKVLQRVIDDAKKEGRKGLVLTCKDRLIHYYAKFRFVNEGISQSVHGDVVWYQMRLTF